MSKQKGLFTEIMKGMFNEVNCNSDVHLFQGHFAKVRNIPSSTQLVYFGAWYLGQNKNEFSYS